jgi:hypothetical protein
MVHNASPTMPHMIHGQRSASLALSLTSGLYAPPHTEGTDSPSFTYPTLPLLSSSLPNPSTIAQEFSPRHIIRSHSIKQLSGPSLKRDETDVSSSGVLQVKHWRKVKATSGPHSKDPQTVTVIPREQDVKFQHTWLVSILLIFSA